MKLACLNKQKTTKNFYWALGLISSTANIYIYVCVNAHIYKYICYIEIAMSISSMKMIEEFFSSPPPFFETGSFCVASDVPELTMQIKRALNSQRYTSHCYLNTSIKGVHYYTRHDVRFSILSPLKKNRQHLPRRSNTKINLYPHSPLPLPIVDQSLQECPWSFHTIPQLKVRHLAPSSPKARQDWRQGR